MRSPPAEPTRLLELDALRGIAVLMVVAFHYSTRYQDIYQHTDALAWSAPYGYHGVNLFFTISGFVIFMTLDKTRRPLDFIVSRFSRLYPAFWCAVLGTYFIGSLTGFRINGSATHMGQALVNLTMLHDRFNVPSVDPVYWTLSVELSFYAVMFVLYLTGALRHVRAVVGIWLALKLLYDLSPVLFGFDAPGRIGLHLVLRHLPFFAIGILFCDLKRGRADPAINHALIVLAIIAAYVDRGPSVAWAAASCAGLFYLMIHGRLRVLNVRPLLFFGTISYSMYLLHQSNGWLIIHALQSRGVPADWSVLIAAIAATAMAAALTMTVERPAMNWIRSAYRGRPGLAPTKTERA